LGALLSCSADLAHLVENVLNDGHACGVQAIVLKARDVGEIKILDCFEARVMLVEVARAEIVMRHLRVDLVASVACVLRIANGIGFRRRTGR